MIAFFTARQEKRDAYRIKHKLSAEHNGYSIKNDLWNGFFFCLGMDFCSFTDETQLTRIFIAKCNWAKWMFAILSQLSNDRFRFGFSHSIYTYWRSKLLEMKCAKIWCDHLWLAILPLVSCVVGNESLL